jgi:hypothetical protein
MIAKKAIFNVDNTFLPMYNVHMPERSRKRKKKMDTNQLAKSIVEEATTEELLQKAAKDGKNPAAVILGRLGGLKGGKARARKLSAKKRTEIARAAALARWQNND